MDDYKACATPFQSSVKLTKYCDSSKVNAILYHQLVSSLIYLTQSRPYIFFVVSVVSHFMQDPREIHWKATKCIIHYLNGTSSVGIKYNQISNSLVSYTDSNWASDSDDQERAFNLVFHFSSRPLVWSCQKQKVVSLSNMEVQYHCVVNVDTEVVWTQLILCELEFPIEAWTIIHCGNQSEIQVTNNLVAHSKLKHVELHAHYLGQLVQ